MPPPGREFAGLWCNVVVVFGMCELTDIPGEPGLMCRNMCFVLSGGFCLLNETKVTLKSIHIIEYRL